MATDSTAAQSPSQPMRPFPGRMPGGRSLIDGPIAPALVMFSLPLLGTNVLQSLSMTVGAIWISHVLGPAGLTATVNAQILMMMLMGAVMGVGMAANIVVAQSFGMGDHVQMKRVVGSAMSFFVLSSVVLGVIGILSAPAILDAMRTPPDARAQAIIYLRWTCISMPIVFTFMFAMMLMRGSGDARTPFLFSLVSILLGFVFSPILLTGAFGFPNLGIAGAVIGGMLANLVGLIAMFVHMYRNNNPVVLKGHELGYLKPDLDILKVLILRGMPMGLQMFIMSGASIVMLSLVNDYGVNVAAAYGAASQLWSYVQMPAMALAASVSSMAAQNIGAGRWDRVNKLAGVAILIGLAITVAVVGLLYVAGEWPLRLFLPNGGEALEVALVINYHVLWGWIPFAVTFVLFGIVRANAAIIPPTIILTIALWLIRVPFAEMLQPTLGMDAIWWSFPLGTIVSAALAAAYYRWGGWRKNKLMMAFGRPGAMRAPEPAALAPDAATAAAVITPSAPSAIDTPRTGAAAIAELRKEIEAMQRRHNLLEGASES